VPCRRAPVTVREVRVLRHGGDDGLPVQSLPEIDDLLLEPDDLLLQDRDFGQKLQCLGTIQKKAEIRRELLRNCNELWVGLLCEIDRKAMKGTDLRRQERGEARQSAQRPRERPLQSSVDVLLVPQLLPQFVHLQLEIEMDACPQQKCNGLASQFKRQVERQRSIHLAAVQFSCPSETGFCSSCPAASHLRGTPSWPPAPSSS